MKPVTVVDGTTLSALRCLRAFFRGFDALAPGESLELRHPQDPAPMLRLLQRARPLSFEWHPLERGEEGFRVEVIRRAAATPICPGHLLELEYRWMDQALTEVDWRAERRLWPGAWSRWGACRLWIDRHRDMEEPLLSEVIGADPASSWAVEPLRADHRKFQRLARDVGTQLAAHDVPASRSAISELKDALGLHHALERNVLYPRLDAAFGATLDVVDRMQAV